MNKEKYISWFKDVNAEDVLLVGGKNASLGEMFSRLNREGINVPDGFALTTNAYWYYLKFNRIDKKLKEIFKKFEPKSIKSLQRTGGEARNLILKSGFPEDLKREIIKAYRILGKKYGKNPDVAVRSSGIVEDQPEASFAGQFESFLNVSGEEELLLAVKKCLSSAFNDRVISYREEKGFSHLKFALSVGVQKMVRSDLASSGVIFTLDTETGFKNVVLINSIYGVGEMIVKGKIIPDEFYVFKPTLKQGYKSIIIKNLGSKTRKYIYAKGGGLKEINVPKKRQLQFSLSNEEILTLAKWACQIEEHYGIPQDIEWAKDGKTKQLFIVQSRPETVHTPKEMKVYPHAKRGYGVKGVKIDKVSPRYGVGVYEEYEIKTAQKPILTGIAIGNKIGQGRIRVIPDVSKVSAFQKGEILVTKMTDPDWVVAMRLASGIITNEGGKTCHAAIISRELGIPAIVGTKKATEVLKIGQLVTLDCTIGQGRVFEGKIPCRVRKYNLKRIPKLPVRIVVNIGAPEIAFKTSFLPVQGVGLARQEFIIAEKIRVHPLALYHYREIRNPKGAHQSGRVAGGLESEIRSKFQISKSKIQNIIKQIDEITVEHKDKREYFVKELAEGIAQIAAAFWPREVIVRLSDLKSNEYRALIGGELFEPEEPNPMLGWRGASRYYDEKFQPAFEMECQAIKRAREIFGLKNIWVMVPFCRTVDEGKKVLDLLAKNGLKKGENDLRVIVMCEIPSNVILAEEFLEIFDGMSIGSNDLTQLILGIDRDNALIAHIGDEFNEASKKMIKKVIKVCRQKKKYIGICGDAPSTIKGFAQFLIDSGIEAISLSPDAVMKVILNLSTNLKRKR